MKYAYTLDPDRYSNEIEAESLREACVIVVAELNLKAGNSFFIGRSVECDTKKFVPQCLCGDVIDALGDLAGDEAGEVAEEWPCRTAKEYNLFQARLSKTIVEFFMEHDLEPTFFIVEDTKEIIVTE